MRRRKKSRLGSKEIKEFSFDKSLENISLIGTHIETKKMSDLIKGKETEMTTRHDSDY